MARTARLALLCLGLAALLAGCAQLGPMPELPPGKVMSKDEQQSKVDGIIERGQTHERDAEKQIEGDK
jgi:predicted small lipoprotein YifL